MNINENMRWDPSIVKKYSSSNHYKLINQLRNEVIKYPLSRKKNLISNTLKDNKINNNEKIQKPQNLNFSNETNINRDKNNNNKSIVSFNNSKDFSIYNNTINKANKVKKDQHETNLLDLNKSDNQLISSTSKDLLKEIEIK